MALTTKNLELIEVAAMANDEDEAALMLQNANGITDGGIASMFFSGADWSTMDKSERVALLTKWITYELNFG